MTPCTDCHGDKTIERETHYLVDFDQHYETIECPTCDGSGEVAGTLDLEPQP